MQHKAQEQFAARTRAAGSSEADTSAWVCPSTLDTSRLREEIVRMYADLARSPASDDFHFHVGAAYAVRDLGYDGRALAQVPAASTSRFAGVGNPHLAGPIGRADVVLDHACGAGTDLLLAAGRLGAQGRAIGVDLTPGMRAAAMQAAEEAGLSDRVTVLEGAFEALPLPDACIDVVISNGVLNLATDKPRVLGEVRRVLRPGGALYLADVIVDRELSPIARGNARLWASCIGGALTEAALLDMLVATGFAPPVVVARHDPYRGTELARKLGGALQVTSLTLQARTIA